MQTTVYRNSVQRLRDIPRGDDLNEVKKFVREMKRRVKLTQEKECANIIQLMVAKKLIDWVASLEAQLQVVGIERKVALENVSSMEGKIEVLTVKHGAAPSAARVLISGKLVV